MTPYLVLKIPLFHELCPWSFCVQHVTHVSLWPRRMSLNQANPWHGHLGKGQEEGWKDWWAPSAYGPGFLTVDDDFSFFFFFFFRATPKHMEVLRLGFKLELQLPEPATYTTAHGNAGSLTHWTGPRIKSSSSWILVVFITTETQWGLLISHSYPCLVGFISWPHLILLCLPALGANFSLNYIMIFKWSLSLFRPRAVTFTLQVPSLSCHMVKGCFAWGREVSTSPDIDLLSWASANTSCSVFWRPLGLLSGEILLNSRLNQCLSYVWCIRLSYSDWSTIGNFQRAFNSSVRSGSFPYRPSIFNSHSDKEWAF